MDTPGERRRTEVASGSGRRAFRSAWLIVLVLLGAALAGAVVMARGAQAGTPLNATLVSTTSKSGTSLSGETCTAAKSTVDGLTSRNSPALQVAPSLFPSLPATDLTVAAYPSTSCTTLTLQGTTRLFGKSTVPVLVVGQWTSSTSTAPVFTILFGFQSVGLSTLVAPGSTAVGVGLSHAWLATTTASGGATITPSDLAQNAAFFSGMDTSTLTVGGSGITFAGVPSASGGLATALAALHVTPSDIQLTGTLSGSVGDFSATAPPAVSAGLSITASVSPTYSSAYFSLPKNAFTLTVAGTSGGTWSVTLTGKATVDVPDVGSGQFTATITVKKGSPSGVELLASADLQTVHNAFGESWLTLTDASLSLTLGGGGTSASLSATATVDSVGFHVGATVSASGLTADLSVRSTSSAKTLSLTSLARLVSGGALPTGTPTVTLTDLSVSIQVPKSGSPMVAVEGKATLTVLGRSLSVVALVRDTATKGLLVAARPGSSLTLSDVVPSLPSDMTMSLPKLSFVFSSTASTYASSTLDTASFAYFRGIYCAGTTLPRATSPCTFSASIEQGVGITAAVDLPVKFKQMVCKLVHPTKPPAGTATTSSCVEGPVTVDGQLPLFGSSTLSLDVALPEIRVQAGPVQQVTAFFKLAKSTSGFSMSVGGSLVMLVPGTRTALSDCPTGIAAPSTNPTEVCITLTVTGALTLSSAGVSVTVTGSLSGNWKLPHNKGLTWLTIQNLTVGFGVTAGEDVGLTLSARGTIVLGTATTLGLSVVLSFSPEPPWVELLGFRVKSKEGISMSDLAAVYHDVTGNSAPSALPPLALKNLDFSYASVTRPKFALCKGLRISAALVITTTTSTHNYFSSSTPVTSKPSGTLAVLTCSTRAPSKTSVCKSDSHSCLASIFLTISTQGIVGAGHLSGWSAGPLEVTTTNISITLTTSAVQIDISGGGTLRTPVLYKSDGSSAPIWLSGQVTLQVGTKHLGLTASGNIAGHSASVSGTGSFDLQNPGFTLTSWFTTAKHWIETTVGGGIKSGMTTVGTTVQTWYTTYVAPNVSTLASDLQSDYTELTSASQGTWHAIFAIYQQVHSVVTTINSALNSIGANALDITVNWIFNDAMHGFTFGGWACIDGHCLIPSYHVTGWCTQGRGGPLCAATFSNLVPSLQQYFASPAVTTKLSTTAHLSLPPGAGAGTMVKRLHAVDPSTTSTNTISCAMSKENFATGYESATALEVHTLGTTVTITGPKPTTMGNPADQGSLNQSTLDSVYSGTNSPIGCTPPVDNHLPPLSMSLSRSWVDEGGSVTLNGYVATDNVTSVLVTWGDGTPATVVDVTPSVTGKVTASHVYADETGTGGQASPFTVTLSASGVTPVSQKIAVEDAPISVTGLSVTPGSTDVMQPVTVSGTVSGFEPGEPANATVTWGDGTAATTVPVSPDGSFSATHVYEKLVPSGQPVRTEPIAVSVAEADGTTAQASTSVTVHDVAPSDATLTATSGATTSGGNVFTHASTAVGWAAQAFDVSPVQGLSFDVNWADGTAHAQATITPATSGPNAAGLYTYAVANGFTHAFADACLYTVTTTVTDVDTLSTSVTTPVVVTAPLGFTPTGPGYWREQFAAAAGRNRGGQVGAATLGCYLEIAQHLSPGLGPNLTPAAASSILQPSLGHLSATEKLVAQLRRQLLTVLLDFSNGSWDWTQAVGQGGATFGSLVTGANEALASQSPQAMQAALDALDNLVS